MSTHRSSGTSPRPRRRRLRLVALAGVLVILVLVLLALPFRGVPREAGLAKTDLERAVAALRTGDLAQAREATADARAHVDQAQDVTEGPSGIIWSHLPLVGTPMADARHLVAALGDVTSVVETTVDLYPSVAGDQATLLRNERVDEATLKEVVAGAQEIGEHLQAAQHELEQVRGTTPIVGDTIADRREQAASLVSGPADTFDDLEPMLETLPAFFGFEGRRSYLVALLNPSELRFSGGAALAFAPLSFDDGQLTLTRSRTVLEDPALRRLARWQKVRGNPFHASRGRVTNATFAPSWSVSGEELLRSWTATHQERHNGVIAIDVVALSRLLGVSGGITVPGYGELTEENLVKRLVGSYDDYYPNPDAQDQSNNALVPAFKDLMFDGGDYVAKARALGDSARGRHFALYFRDEAAQRASSALGLDGDLARGDGDYVGVFTQNVNGSKVDFYQRRQLNLDVTLKKDGSSTNRLEVLVDNDTPPYPFSVPDPKFGYFTRYAEIRLAAFLPGGTSVREARQQGQPWQPPIDNYYERTFVKTTMQLSPASEGEASLLYDVPAAASVDPAGGLRYRLALDPQGTVIPEGVDVTVRLPAGYRATVLPDGWSAAGRELTYANDALTTTQSWEIPVRAGSGDLP